MEAEAAGGVAAAREMVVDGDGDFVAGVGAAGEERGVREAEIAEGAVSGQEADEDAEKEYADEKDCGCRHHDDGSAVDVLWTCRENGF